MAAEPLRIMMVTSAPGWGGGEVYAANLARALRARGHHVAFSCRRHTNMSVALDREGIPWRPTAPRNSGDVRAALRIALELRRGRYDVIHAHFSRDYVPVLAAAWLAGVPAVVTRHVLFHMSSHTARAVARADRILCVSDAVRKVLVEELGLPGERVTTLHTGADLEQFRPLGGPRRLLPDLGIPAEAPVFGMVNHIGPGKRCDLFIRAAAQVKQSHPEGRFVIVGNIPPDCPEETLIQELGMGRELKLAGFREDVPDILPEFDVLVTASESEGLNHAIIEAMACGVPVLATAMGPHMELVDDGQTGSLYPSGDLGALVAGMLWMLDHPEERRAMGEAARARAEESFGDETMIDRLEEVYRAVQRG